MKKLSKILGIIALVAVIGFGMTACGSGGGGGDMPLFSVSGEFKGAGSGNALFKAATTASRSARSAAATYELTGEIEDGDMVFRLRGTYDSETGTYIVSSASSFARYTISGTASSATATLAVKKQDDTWESFIVSVTVKEVTIQDKEPEAEYTGGLPVWARGNWHDWWALDKDNYSKGGFEAWSYFDQWYYEAWRSSVWQDNWNFAATKYTVIEAEKLDGDVYDVIFSYPVYKGTDAQKKAALEKFFKDNNHPAEFWNKRFDPWDRNAWIGGGDDEGKNWDNSVIWYICMNEDHRQFSHAHIINWETFIKFFKTEDERNAFWGSAGSSTDLFERREAVEAFLAEKEISSFYYWGWHEADWDVETPHLERRYTCWGPAGCEEDGWGDKTHYYLKWGNQTGISGNWDKNRDLYNKWTSEDYLITYLRSQNVQPVTWYTRARIWKDEDGTVRFFYYNGDDEARKEESHDAPACDTKSLSKIKGLKNFDADAYPDYSYLWVSPDRTTPRGGH